MAETVKYIDATALCRAVKDSRNINPHPDPIFRAMYIQLHECILGLIAEAPAVAVREDIPGGAWVPSMIPGYLCCSACKDAYIGDDWADEKKWGFCPNCGARMNHGRI